MWSAKINASTAKYEAPDEVDPVVIQYHQLHITEESFRSIVVSACLIQTDPVQFEPSHQSPRLFRLTRVCVIPIERDPDLRISIAASHSIHELADVMRTLARQLCPIYTTAPHILDDKQLEATTRLLPAVEHLRRREV